MRLTLPAFALFRGGWQINFVAFGVLHVPDTARPHVGFFNDGWKTLDFVVVVIGWVGVASSSINLNSARLLRLLRPLRMLSHYKALQVLVETLIRSLKGPWRTDPAPTNDVPPS